MLVTYEIWVTNFGPNTCERCASLHGAIFKKGEGPQPPLHPHCRCQRKFHHQAWIEPLGGTGELEREGS